MLSRARCLIRVRPLVNSMNRTLTSFVFYGSLPANGVGLKLAVPTVLAHRSMTQTQGVNNITITEFLKIVENKANLKENVIIFDVREIHEIEETGVIPGGINIPLGSLKNAFELSPTEFHKSYGIDKPKKNTKMIFSCRSGKRSLMAYTTVQQLGYENLYNYSGGWLGYADYIKSQK